MTNEAERLEAAESQILELLGKRIAAGTAKSTDIIAWVDVRISRSLRSIDQRLGQLVDGVHDDKGTPIATVLNGLGEIEWERIQNERLRRHTVQQRAWELDQLAEQEAKQMVSQMGRRGNGNGQG